MWNGGLSSKDIQPMHNDLVTFDDWRDAVNAALAAAKQGDNSVRAWLGQYLLGRPEMKAPTPLNVVVQQLNRDDPVVDRLARPVINRELFPMANENDEWEKGVKALVAADRKGTRVSDRTGLRARAVHNFLKEIGG